MKKTIALLLMVAMIIALVAGCTSTPAAPSTSGTPSSSGTEGTTTGGDGTAAAPASTIKWVTQAQGYTTNASYQQYDAWLANIEKAAGGAITFDRHPVGDIADYNDMMTVLQAGGYDMMEYGGTCVLQMMGNLSYLVGLSGGPGTYQPEQFLAWMYAGGGYQVLKDLWESYGGNIYVSTGNCQRAEVFAHSNVKLDSLEAFKGIKFRTQGLWATVLESFGASVVNITGGDIYQSAERGLIDAFEYVGPMDNYNMGFTEITKYMELPGIHSPICTSHICANPDSWNAIPENLQHIITQLSHLYSFTSTNEAVVVDTEGLSLIEAAGVETVYLPDDVQLAIVEKAAEFHRQFMAEDPKYKEIFMNQKAFINGYSHLYDYMQPKISVYDMEF